MAFGGQLLVHLWAKAVHQHNAHAHALNERQVLRQVGQLACGNGLARDTDHKGLAAMHVDIRRDRTEPRHKGEVKNGGHVGWFVAGKWVSVLGASRTGIIADCLSS